MSHEVKSSLVDVDAKGAFQRKVSQFRNWIKVVSETYPPEANRYHLYISLACPWAHRTYIVRALKGLEHIIGLSIVDYHMASQGWKFSTPEETPGSIPDTNEGAHYLRDLYLIAEPDYDGRFTVPVLWDKKTRTIVNNESSEILRMFNSEFNEWARHSDLDLYPEALRSEIDVINEDVYPSINNGVYRCGFAKTQEAYEQAFQALFTSLEKYDSLLGSRRYLTGATFTEADIRLFTTLVRFDPVYVGHFKCNLKQLREFPNLHAYLKEIYQMPLVTPTVNFTHIKRHYYMSHPSINPSGIVPVGPELALLQTPHGREKIEFSSHQ